MQRGQLDRQLSRQNEIIQDRPGSSNSHHFSEFQHRGLGSLQLLQQGWPFLNTNQMKTN